MTAYLSEIQSILSANTTEVGSGTDWPVYGGHLPDSTTADDRAVALIQTVGAPEMERVEVESLGLQVLVRGQPQKTVATAYPDADEIAFAVKNALRGFTGTPAVSGAKLYLGVWCEGGPGFIGHDQALRPIFSANFRVERSRT